MDDATITITQNKCFNEVYKELQDYEKATGAKINYSKSVQKIKNLCKISLSTKGQKISFGLFLRMRGDPLIFK